MGGSGLAQVGAGSHSGGLLGGWAVWGCRGAGCALSPLAVGDGVRLPPVGIAGM